MNSGFKLSEERIENLERENRDLISKYEGLNIQFTSKKDLTESLTKSLILAEVEIFLFQLRILKFQIKLDELHRIKTASSELETELIKRKKEILELNKTIIDLNKKLKPFLIKKVIL